MSEVVSIGTGYRGETRIFLCLVVDPIERYSSVCLSAMVVHDLCDGWAKAAGYDCECHCHPKKPSDDE